MDTQIISIFLEAIIAIFCLLAAIQRKKLFAYGFALTFLIYVFYDSVRYFNLPVSLNVLYFSFFLSTVSALLAAVLMYLEGNFQIVRTKRR
ncbi:MAG: hypothetical protein ABIH28_00800 [archaeon]